MPPRTRYSSVAAIAEFPGQAEFATKYEAEYDVAPGRLQRLRATPVPRSSSRRSRRRPPTATSPARPSARPAPTPRRPSTTVLGDHPFDAVGDTSQKIISLYKVDMTAGDGTGDWVFEKQVDYAE